MSPHVFDRLTPDRVLDLVDGALGGRCTGICRPRASYINRVYEIERADGSFVIAKFYRPGRWSRTALQDELDFVAELAAEELPVVPPLPGRDGAWLQTADDICFALYPRCGGRALEEVTPDMWSQLGRLLGRLHNVGARHPPRERITLGPRTSMASQVQVLLESGLIPANLREEYSDAAELILEEIAPLFEDVPLLRIHGDCHHGNVLCRPGEGLHIIDFDDMAMGPAVQDLWMLLPARPRDCLSEIDAFAEGYETFRPFDWAELRLVEPLRAMRYVHYAAWCARQQVDQGSVSLVPDWGSAAYWRQEITQLANQRDAILDERDAPPLG